MLVEGNETTSHKFFVGCSWWVVIHQPANSLCHDLMQCDGGGAEAKKPLLQFYAINAINSTCNGELQCNSLNMLSGDVKWESVGGLWVGFIGARL